MRKKYFYCNCKLPMNLQFFADGGDGGDGAGAGGNGDGAGAESFDDFLQKDGNQAEFDRRMQKAIEKAVNKAQEKWRVLTDDKLSEAERLAKMTKEEKAEYQQKKREKELSDREAAVTRKELMAEAKNTLAEKNLPAGLAGILDYSDADAYNKSILAVEKAFQKAVEDAVNERLKGGKPPKKAPDQPIVTKEDYAKMGYAERLELKTKHPELYKQLSGR